MQNKNENTSHIKGSHNIVIQNVTDSTITLNINGNFKEIRNDIAELKALMLQLNAQFLQFSDKTFHKDEIGTNDFNTHLQNSNNAIISSTIHARRDVNVGTTTNIIKGVSFLALVLLLAIGFWQQENLKKFLSIAETLVAVEVVP